MAGCCVEFSGICLAVSVVPKIIAQTQAATSEAMVSTKMADWSLPSSANVPEPASRCRIPPQKLTVGPQRRCLVGCLVLPHVDCPKQKRCASILLVGM